MKLPSKLLGLVLGPLAFGLIIYFFNPKGLSPEANAVLACTLWMAIWWVLEVIPISATALLPLVLFPLSGALDINTTSAAYGHKYVFLYLGGFMIALAIEKWNLHKRIALQIINFIGTDVSRIILGFMVATAFMSMWISNTATSVMMLPIGMAVIKQLQDKPSTIEDEKKTFGQALMLGIAYSASIGGMATLIGTPPNLVFAGVVEELYKVDISFSKWITFGLPIAIILLVFCWYYLTRKAFKIGKAQFPGGKTEIHRLLRELGGMSSEEKNVLLVFVATALLWIVRALLQQLVPAIDDTIIAMAGALILFLIPAKSTQEGLLQWQDTAKLPWGIILLFGGGMALASGFQSSGLASWLGTQMTSLQGMHMMLVVLIIITAVNFLTEITSNLATTAMLLPILAPLAFTLDVHPYLLMLSATLAASSAFMLPIATPPNAVVFGSGYLRIPDMIRTGVWLNLVSIALVFLAVYFFLPSVWNFEALHFPSSWKSFKALAP